MIIGDTFGRWVVSGGHYSKGKKTYQECTCACGSIRMVSRCHLNSGASLSCGCLRLERVTKHGLYKTKEYQCWQQFRKRCDNQKDKDYPSYGGRGITYCSQWVLFSNFLQDMGDAPKGTSLDRKNNNEGYSKENCHWATPVEQQRNRRNTVWLTYNGISKPLTEWAELTGILEVTLRYRIRKGWSIAKALNYEEEA